MLEIKIGCVLLEHRASSEPKLYGRVVHLDKQLNLLIIVRFPGQDKHGHQKNYVCRPVINDLNAWERKILDKKFSVAEFDSPSHWLLTSDQLRSNASTGLMHSSRRNLKLWLKRRSEAYRLIRPFVHGRTIEEIVMNPAFVGWPERRALELNLKNCARIQRTLNAYILALGNRNGLLPWYSHCGNPGQPKFSRTKTGRPICETEVEQRGHEGMNCDQFTRIHFALGWKKYKKRGVSVRTAFNRTLNSWFAKSVIWDGPNAKVTLRPEALKFTSKQFVYWGMRGNDALSAIAINKGETAARRTWQRRQGNIKDRHLSVNGEAFVDSTSCDQTLVSCASRLKVLSSPWRTDVLGAATDYIFGHHVGFESPSQTTTLMAILHAAEDKVEYCARYGIRIRPRDWLSMTFRQIVTDNGEGKGELAMAALEDMEGGASFGAAYDAINKATSESQHASTQAHVDHLMPGSTMGRRAERGEASRTSLARQNLFEYMPQLINHVLHHNNNEIINLPTIEMRRDGVEPTRRGIVEWMIANGYSTSAPTDFQSLRIRCLPRLQACLQYDGIHLYDPTFNGKRIIPSLVYSSDWLRGTALLSQGRRRHLEVHLNPSDLTKIWVNLAGLKSMTLQSRDSDLHELTLLDWLTISCDDRIRSFLGKAIKIQEGVNAVATLNRSVQIANKERNAEIKSLGAKPKKSELKRDRRENTNLEKIAMTGVPVAPKDYSTLPPSAAPRESLIKPVSPAGNWTLDLAQAIRASRPR